MAKNNNLTDFLTGVADAIRAKKGTSSPINPQDFESEIENIQTGVDTADATATAADIRVGKTAYVNEEKVEGSIQDYNGESEPASGKSLFAQLADRSITEVTAEDLTGITKIGANAFADCSRLTSITIPNTITHLLGECFKGSAITEIKIPDSVTSIEHTCFSSCYSLKKIILSNKISQISNNLFYGCMKLAEIFLPEAIKLIGANAFNQCTSLVTIIIPGNVTKIDFYAFSGCNKLSSVKLLPTTPPSLGSSVFSNTASDLQIIVPKGTLDAYKSATNWSAYADKMVEANE